jgi:hypothetical protein
LTLAIVTALEHGLSLVPTLHIFIDVPKLVLGKLGEIKAIFFYFFPLSSPGITIKKIP